MNPSAVSPDYSEYRTLFTLKLVMEQHMAQLILP